MTTLKELNGKVWYRFLKVIYILCYLPYFLLLFIIITEGKDYHDPILPDTVQEILKDPEFYKLDDYEMKDVLSSISRKSDKLRIKDNSDIVPFYDLPDEFQNKLIHEYKKEPIPNIPLSKKYEYKSFYTWDIIRCFKYGLILTVCYVLVMECIRRGFYYVLIGKVFPKE